MINTFGEVNGGVFTGLKIRRGGEYGGNRFGKNSPDNTYINAGLYPIVKGDKPTFNPGIGELKDSYVFDGAVINRIWTIDYYDLNRVKDIKLSKLRNIFDAITRPRVAVTLESGVIIEVDGGRTDKDNFREENLRLIRVGATESQIKDADNVLHDCTVVDVKTAYEAIVDNYSILMKSKWATENAINDCTTIECIDLLKI